MFQFATQVGSGQRSTCVAIFKVPSIICLVNLNFNPMDLFKLSDFQPEYRKSFEDSDIVQFEVWTERKERVGRVADILMDDIGQLYYLVLEIGFWLNRRLVLIAPEQFQLDRPARHVYLMGLSKRQVEGLPSYNPALRNSKAIQSSASEEPLVLPVEASAPLESLAILDSNLGFESVGDRAQSALQPTLAQSPIPQPPVSQPLAQPLSSPQLAEPIAQAIIQLLEERLVIKRQKRKVGEIIVRKQIETRLIEVPVRRETLIVEQISPERKQLAIVDLPSTALGADLDLGSSAHEDRGLSQSSGQSIGQSTSQSADTAFVSVEMAQQALAAIQSGSKQARVKLVFEEAGTQRDYQQYLNYSSSRSLNQAEQ